MSHQCIKDYYYEFYNSKDKDVILHSEQELPKLVCEIQAKLREFCDTVIEFNTSRSGGLYRIVRLVQGSVTYSQEANTVDMIITGGLKPVRWSGDVFKFLNSEVQGYRCDKVDNLTHTRTN